MTIEEKAKAYDKALSKAKEYYFQGQAPDKLAELESIFPELRESEDDRVRKSLINFLSSFELMRDDVTFRKGDFDLDAIKGYISYLEKQKDQKPVISDEAIREGVAHFGITQYQIDYWLKKHINIVEYQPAWSEENEFFRQQLIVYCENCVQDTLAAKCVDWLKSLRPKPHWKPSEEQMEAFEESLMSVAYTENKTILESLYEQLKNL